MAEMEGSLGSQLQFGVLQQLQNQQSSNQQQITMIQQQQLDQLRMINDSMRAQMMGQAQSRMLGGSIAQQMSAYPSHAGSAISQGFGFSPESLNTFSMMSRSSMAALGGVSTGVLTGLASNHLMKTMSQYSAEQRSVMASRLGYRAAEIGATTVGTAIDIGTALGGLFAGGMLTNSVGAMVGFGLPVLGTAAGSIFRHGARNLREQGDLTEFFQRESYRFVRPDTATNRTGIGQSLRDSQEFSNRIRHLNQIVGMSNEDFQTLTKDLVEANLVTGAADLERFEKKLVQQIGFIRSSAKILNKTHKEIVGLMGDFKKLGIDTENFDFQSARIKFTASAMGIDQDTATQVFVSNTGQRIQGTRISGNTAMGQIQMASAMMAGLLDSSKSSNPSMFNLITNMGGRSGAGESFLGVLDTILQNPQMSVALAGAFVGNDGNVDANKIAEVLQGVRAGNLTFRGITDSGLTNLNSMSTAMRHRINNSSGEILRNVDPATLMDMAEILVSSTSNWARNEIGTDPQALLEEVFQLSPQYAQLLSGAASFNRTNGPQLRAQLRTAPALAAMEAGRDMYRLKWWEKLQYGWENIMDRGSDAIFTNPANNFAAWLDDLYASKAGINVAAAEYRPQYGPEYYDFSAKGIQKMDIQNNKQMLEAVDSARKAEERLKSLGVRTNNIQVGSGIGGIGADTLQVLKMWQQTLSDPKALNRRSGMPTIFSDDEKWEALLMAGSKISAEDLNLAKEVATSADAPELDRLRAQFLVNGGGFKEGVRIDIANIRRKLGIGGPTTNMIAGPGMNMEQFLKAEKDEMSRRSRVISDARNAFVTTTLGRLDTAATSHEMETLKQAAQAWSVGDADRAMRIITESGSSRVKEAINSATFQVEVDGKKMSVAPGATVLGALSDSLGTYQQMAEAYDEGRDYVKTLSKNIDSAKNMFGWSMWDGLKDKVGMETSGMVAIKRDLNASFSDLNDILKANEDTLKGMTVGQASEFLKQQFSHSISRFTNKHGQIETSTLRKLADEAGVLPEVEDELKSITGITANSEELMSVLLKMAGVADRAKSGAADSGDLKGALQDHEKALNDVLSAWQSETKALKDTVRSMQLGTNISTPRPAGLYNSSSQMQLIK